MQLAQNTPATVPVGLSQGHPTPPYSNALHVSFEILEAGIHEITLSQTQSSATPVLVPAPRSPQPNPQHNQNQGTPANESDFDFESLSAEYQKLSQEPRYAMIVCIKDQVVELECWLCKGNHYIRGTGRMRSSGKPQPIKGISRITNSHKERVEGETQKRDYAWIARWCVLKTLSNEEVEAVRAGTYEVHRTLCRPHMVDSRGQRSKQV